MLNAGHSVLSDSFLEMTESFTEIASVFTFLGLESRPQPVVFHTAGHKTTLRCESPVLVFYHEQSEIPHNISPDVLVCQRYSDSDGDELKQFVRN